MHSENIPIYDQGYFNGAYFTYKGHLMLKFYLAYVLFYCMVLCYAYANSTFCILSACSKPRVHSVNAQLVSQLPYIIALIKVV